jgi:hypothetical protein
MSKMSSSKKIDFAAVVYLSEARNPIPPPPLHTTWIRVYIIFINTGKGRRVEPERKLEGQQFTKRKSLYRSLFLDDDILLWCVYS